MSQLGWGDAPLDGSRREQPVDGTTRASQGDQERQGDELPPLDDPYLTAPERAPRATISRLAVASLVSAFFGPVGAICAIVLGWIARREIARGEARQGRGLATAGLVLGAILTMAWGGALGLFVWSRHHEPRVAVSDPAAAEPATAPQADPLVTASPTATSTAAPPAGGTVPKSTRLTREGNITVIDVGVSVSSLQDELARQRAEAAGAGETLLLMTTRAGCGPCDGVERGMKDPLMQTALTKVRLVRVDISVFGDDLDALKVPRKFIPGFYLLSLDLTPKDGINGGEWEEDIPPNFAPVLGAFVRGKYTARKQVWQPLPGSGIKL